MAQEGRWAATKADHPSQWIRAVYFFRVDGRNAKSGHEAAKSRFRDVPDPLTWSPAASAARAIVLRGTGRTWVASS